MKKAIIISVILVILYLAAASASASPATETAAEYTGLKNQINQLLQSETGTYGIYIIDLKSGKSLGINHLESFHAASTFKLPMNLYLYKKISEGSINPLTMLTYRQEHYEGGTGRLQYDPVGSSYSIKMLSKYSIVYSDNVATNMLLAYLGRSNIKNFMRSVGGTVVSDDKNITCPRDMAIYMEELLKFNSQHPELGKELMSNLQNTVFNNRIPKLIPPNVKIAHKIGNWPPTGTYNDVGYVEHPERPYIISIFSKNTENIYRAFSILQKISKIAYDYQDRLAINLLLNGRPPATSSPPVLENGRVLVPVRILAEVMGAEVRWDDLTQTVIIIKNEKRIALTPGSSNAGINGNHLSPGTAAKIIQGRTMVSLRFVSETLGAAVNWDNTTKTVSVEYNNQDQSNTGQL